MIFSQIKKLIPKTQVLVLLGPTASGKTALSLELAKEFDGEIISADSRQVYRHMDVGTDKIPLEKREGIPHYLLDAVNPDERFTVSHFKTLAEEKIDDILSRGKLPMLVGGTGLYIRAITENYAIPPENPELRAQIENELKILGPVMGPKKLHEKLQKLDPVAGAKIHVNNIPYIVRALEIVMGTGRAKDDHKNPPKYSCLKIGLTWPRDVLTKRISERIDNQITRGLVDETQKLLSMGFGRTLPSMRSLGYREMAEFLAGEITKEEAIGKLKKNTRDFAKRQMTWFKVEKDILWIT